MAQLVVRNLEESVKRRLATRAKAHERSLEAEVREILREAAGAIAAKSASKPAAGAEQKGFGTLLAEHFAGKVPPEFRIPKRSNELPRPAKFK